MDDDTKEYINQKYGLLLEDYVELSDRVDELEQTNQDLRERVRDLEQLVDPDPGSVTYDQLTREQKVQQIRQKLVSLALNVNKNHARLQYKDVQQLFDGHPSPGHCYDLMERAGSIDGFTYDQAGKDGQKRIRVETDAVNELSRFHDVNKATHESPA